MTLSMLPAFQVPIYLLLGIVFGFSGGLLGIGGGLVAIPVLTYLGLDQGLAQGTVLLMITPNVILSFMQYRRRNKIEGKQITPLCIASCVSSLVASHYAVQVDSLRLETMFFIFMSLLLIYYVVDSFYFKTKLKLTISTLFLPFLGIVGGATSGLFSVGGALVVVPLLVTLFSYSQLQAQGIALALVMPGALSALISYAYADNILWYIGIPLAIGGIISVGWGVSLAHKIPPNLLKMLFCMVLFFVVMSSFYRLHNSF